MGALAERQRVVVLDLREAGCLHGLGQRRYCCQTTCQTDPARVSSGWRLTTVKAEYVCRARLVLRRTRARTSNGTAAQVNLRDSQSARRLSNACAS